MPEIEREALELIGEEIVMHFPAVTLTVDEHAHGFDLGRLCPKCSDDGQHLPSGLFLNIHFKS